MHRVQYTISDFSVPAISLFILVKSCCTVNKIMDLQSVLIEYQHTNEKGIYTNSGLLFSKYVLITGNVLMPYLQDLGFHEWYNNLKPGIIRLNPFSSTVIPKLRVVSKTNNSTLNCNTTKVIACFVCNNILASSQKFLKDWAIDFENVQFRGLISLFFILRVKEDNEIDIELNEERTNLNRALNELLLISTSPQFLSIGQDVCIESTPFGNRAFLHSYSQGVISNIFGEHHCLLLTDCSSTPGSEGSPVFIQTRYKEKFVFAMVISCLNWWKGEWVGLTLAANIVPLLRELIPPCYQIINTVKANPKFTAHKFEFLATLTKSIVQVVSGTLWGTGILLNKNKGIFITNSHVIESKAEVVLYWKTVKLKVTILHRTPNFDPFDLAILKCNPKDLDSLEITPVILSTDQVQKGEEIYAAGYPLFPRNLMMKPSITRGYISIVKDFVIKTTATVLPGSSGGPIFDSRGKLIAITVSNTKMDDVGVVYPRVNMAVPILTILGTLQSFLDSGDSQILQKLHNTEFSVRQQWDFIGGKL